jgi:hypothetical protein
MAYFKSSVEFIIQQQWDSKLASDKKSMEMLIREN